jgi:ADP-ribosylglycohydrolase
LLQLISQLAPPWGDAVTAALVGDAFGVPHEFKQLKAIPPAHELAMVMPAAYPKTYASVPYGIWSDDGSQMLALLDALLAREGRYNAQLFGQNLLAWLHEAKYQSGGRVFDCGIQTLDALTQLERGLPVEFNESHCGNGSLMRVLPVAALPDSLGINPVDALRFAMEQSALTHPQALARVSCALYVQLAWLAQAGRRGLRALMPEAAKALEETGLLTALDQTALATILAFGEQHPTNSGYVVDSLWSAIDAVDHASSLSDALCRAVSLGSDTDTVACIAAGLAALVFGWNETAHGWRRQMTMIA